MNNDEKLLRFERQVIIQRNKCLYEQAKNNAKKTIILQSPSSIYVSPESIISNSDVFQFTLNFPLISNKYCSNEDIKETVFAGVRKFSKFRFERGKTPKLCIWITQYLPVTTTGKIKTDVDNADVKGIIDGIAKALQIDDNGKNISLHVEILPIKNGEKAFTKISIIKDDLIVDALNKVLAASGSEPLRWREAISD